MHALVFATVIVWPYNRSEKTSKYQYLGMSQDNQTEGELRSAPPTAPPDSDASCFASATLLGAIPSANALELVFGIVLVFVALAFELLWAVDAEDEKDSGY
jgi:hypothetical protein